MSTLIMQADRPNGYLHMVKEADQHYWVSTIEPNYPMNSRWETIVVKCHKNGSVNKSEWKKPSALVYSENENAAKENHVKACLKLEEFLRENQ